MKKTATKVKPKKKAKGNKSGAVKVVWNPDQTLNVSEEMFCQYYVLNQETRNNGFQSYAIAYGREGDLEKAPKDDAVYEEIEVNGKMTQGKIIQKSSYDRLYATLTAEASKVIRKPYIQRRIYELLNSLLRDDIVDGELAKVMRQDIELPAKMRAIEEYNKLRQRTTKTTVEHEFGNINPEVSDADLKELIKQGEAFFQKKKLPKK